MNTGLRVLLVLTAFAGGGAAGFLAASAGDGGAAEGAAPVVVVQRGAASQTLTAEQAADRIAELETQLAHQPRARAARPSEDSGDDAEPVATAPPPEPPVAAPKKPDGSLYSASELRDLALSADTDPALRRAAIRSLRSDDSPEARAALATILKDGATPLDLRLEAAKALTRQPHRDAAPDELLAALQTPGLDPALRREIAEGVAKLRDKGSWMSEIAGLLRDEGDADVRRFLFDAVQRTAADPAARQELVRIAASGSTSASERQAAAAALARQGVDRRTADALRPLLADGDPLLRESVTTALAKAKALSASEIAAGLADAAPGVRAAAFAANVPPASKEWPAESRKALLASAEAVLRNDPSPDVRRAALQWVNEFPRNERGPLLDAARADNDPWVRISAYARSPAAVVRRDRDAVLAGLDASDPRVRDAAYRVIAQTWNVDVPYRAAWNPRARDRAAAAIREAVATDAQR